MRLRARPVWAPDQDRPDDVEFRPSPSTGGQIGGGGGESGWPVTGPVFVQVLTTRAEAWLAAGQRVSRCSVREHLPPSPLALRFASRLAAAMCTRWQLDGELREHAQLIVNELVTNAVKHAGSGIELTLTVRHHVLRIEVSDDNHLPPHPREASTPGAPGSGGLWLVSQLACHWGCNPTTRGKVIWADLMITGQHTREALPGIDSGPGRGGQDHTGHPRADEQIGKPAEAPAPAGRSSLEEGRTGPSVRGQPRRTQLSR